MSTMYKILNETQLYLIYSIHFTLEAYVTHYARTM